MDAELTDSDVVRVLSAMRTYLLRRRLIGVTQAENKIMPTLGAHLDELVLAVDPEDAFLEQLSSHEYAVRIPNDSELSSTLADVNFYNLGRSRNYPRLLLALAEEVLTKSRPSWDDDKLQFEHIMPQTLSTGWRKELGDDAEDVHQELINNIGNITLIRHNQELGNKRFSEKKKVYAGQSGLQIAQNKVTDRDTWDADAIRRRRDYVMSLIIDHVLVLPDRFRRASNWKQKSGSSSGYNSREVLNELIGERITYVPNPMITAEVVSDSQVLFEDERWHLSPLTKELKARDGTVSPSAAYQGAMYWAWDGTRLTELDS